MTCSRDHWAHAHILQNNILIFESETNHAHKKLRLMFMPPQKSQYVLNFLTRTKHHGSHSSVSTGNDMYALFGFMDDQSKVYKIFQRVRSMKMIQMPLNIPLTYFIQLRRKILFIVRLQMMMRQNHAQSELLKLAESKRERAAKSAEFSFFVRTYQLYFLSNLACYVGFVFTIFCRDWSNFVSCLGDGGFFSIEGAIEASWRWWDPSNATVST